MISKKSHKIKMEDILIPGTKLTAFTIEMTPENLQAIKDSLDRQKKILKQKDIRPGTLEKRITI